MQKDAVQKREQTSKYGTLVTHDPVDENFVNCLVNQTWKDFQ